MGWSAPLSWSAQADHFPEIVTNRYLLLHLITLAWGVICLPAFTHAADERIALLLAGAACRQSHAVLEEDLARIPGVIRINLHVIPDHVLIDANTAIIDADSLVIRANNLLEAQSPCRATLMKSCISADLRTAIGRITPETTPILQLGQ